VPVAEWFRGPLQTRLREQVLGERIADVELFDRDSLEQLIDQHVSGARDHSPALWSLLMFDGFLQRLESNPASTA
jgi:asparagine synthase (glutamine-hydrolysing)